MEQLSSNSERPLSPHLQIYKWQWSMVGSITNRICSILFCVALVLVFVMITLAYLGGSYFDAFYTISSSFLGSFAQILFLFVLFYHTFMGIQHLLWDFGKGFHYSLHQHWLRTIFIFALSGFSSMIVFSLIHLL